MAVKKRDFQKISQLIQEFLGKLCGEEASAELRDALNFALLHLQRYYKCLRTRSDSNGLSNSGIFKSLNTGFTAGVSAISPFCRGGDIFDWKWIHLDSPRLSGGFANDDFAMVKPCLLAAKNADLKELKELIEKDSDCVKQVDGLGRSALMYSVHGNSDEHYQCTELLIDCSSDVNLISNDGCTSLHIACHDNNLQALQLLLKHKAKCNIEDSEGRTPLHWAAANSSTHNIKLLLEHDADIRGCDNNGLTPAMWACHFDQLSNLEFLQEAVESKGCDKDTLMEDIDHDGRSLIHWAVSRNGEQNCLKKLLNKKTALLTDRDGGSVFLAAAKEGSVSACEEIFSVLGNEVLNHLNNKKQSALHIATICGHGGVVDLLLEKGADVNQVDTHGASVMDYAQSLQLHYCTLIFLSHQSQHPTQSTDMKNNQRNAENISEKNSYKTIHQSLVVPSAPLLEEVDSVEPLDEETDQKVDQSVNKRTSFDTQEQESSNTKENRKIPHPAPRQLKRNATEEQTDNTIIKPSRPQRQQTLTRQSNISDNKNESDHQEDQFDTHEFDTHTFDRKVEGEVLILVDDMEGINSESEILINCENETSPSLLDHGHSVSSVHSEQDNAENASISMDMGVSSIGSDSEDNIDDDEADDQSNEILDDQQHQIHKHKHIKRPENVPRNISPMSPTQELQELPVASQSLPSHQRLQPLSMPDLKSKKKKDKKKKKQKLSAPIPPRGFAAPLEPPPPIRMDFPGGHHKVPIKDGYIQGYSELEHRPVNPVPPAHLIELPSGLRGHSPGGQDPMYGHMGPPQGPLAFNHGQNLLKNTDFVPLNGSKYIGPKMLPKTNTRGPSLGNGQYQGQHTMPAVPRPPPPR